VKDYTREELEDAPFLGDHPEWLQFCLDQLYADRQHRVTDEVVRNLTYEELIGALLVGRHYAAQAGDE
jgi:hypothetical protein